MAGYKRVKRAADAVLSAAALGVLSPLFAVTAAAIAIDDGRPVIYTQDRVGKGNELFKIYKFRTMKTGTPCASSSRLRDTDAVTRVGRLLRATSLDELPQLMNVLKGDMSLVGYRPLIPLESEIREKRLQAGIYEDPPGLTGWAQVNGRAAIGDDLKVAYDKEYKEKQSALFDMKILFNTVLQVLTRKDVS
ncbi:MAG: sugar transferase [Oscillospiraceae bacterium]|jgi:O-antigen biosynthesis protein WbqP|nr:sugar transferase [Oscillospiraceae bacterium]